MTVPFGSFEDAWPALDRTDLIAEPVADALRALQLPDVLVVDTDPDKADTAVFCAHYQVPAGQTANCVIVTAKRGEEVTHAACLVLATEKADVNKTVRKLLGARKASFAAMDFAVEATGMEYGGIMPIGLPDGWPILIDRAVADLPQVLIGSGRRRGKVILPGSVLAKLPGAQVVEGLGLA
ncbi:hypothetical protein D5S17_11545 [Pseudonocardiaceae bacterium YIM PH 21723]|nr:hypothetical protein D5S17_11545 [Pseudonocardiaceae bacterium YIM PH 21723]